MKVLNFFTALKAGQLRGIYGIHTSLYHIEDIDFPEQSEGINHYIMVNTDTRLVFLYPEAIVIEEKDLDDLNSFFKKIEDDYLLKFNLYGLANWYIRKLYFSIVPQSMQLPFASHERLLELRSVTDPALLAHSATMMNTRRGSIEQVVSL